jgi:hypothetical protein
MNINDAINAAIADVAAMQNQLNDKLLRYYQANGATSGDLQDAERQFLVTQGAEIVLAAGQIADPSFGTSLSWTQGTGWTVTGNKARVSGAQVTDSFITYNVANMLAGSSVVATRVDEVRNGALEVQVNAVAVIPGITTRGSQRLIATLAAGAIRIKAPAGVVAEVSGLQVQAVTTLRGGIDHSNNQDLWEYYLRVVKLFTGALDDMKLRYWRDGPRP